MLAYKNNVIKKYFNKFNDYVIMLFLNKLRCNLCNLSPAQSCLSEIIKRTPKMCEDPVLRVWH